MDWHRHRNRRFFPTLIRPGKIVKLCKVFRHFQTLELSAAAGEAFDKRYDAHTDSAIF